MQAFWSVNPIPTGCCHVTLIYGVIPPMVGRNRVKEAGEGQNGGFHFDTHQTNSATYESWHLQLKFESSLSLLRLILWPKEVLEMTEVKMKKMNTEKCCDESRLILQMFQDFPYCDTCRIPLFPSQQFPVPPFSALFGIICSFWVETLCQGQKSSEANFCFLRKKWLFFRPKGEKQFFLRETNVLLRAFLTQA